MATLFENFYRYYFNIIFFKVGNSPNLWIIYGYRFWLIRNTVLHKGTLTVMFCSVFLFYSTWKLYSKILDTRKWQLCVCLHKFCHILLCFTFFICLETLFQNYFSIKALYKLLENLEEQVINVREVIFLYSKWEKYLWL